MNIMKYFEKGKTSPAKTPLTLAFCLFLLSACNEGNLVSALNKIHTLSPRAESSESQKLVPNLNEKCFQEIFTHMPDELDAHNLDILFVIHVKPMGLQIAKDIHSLLEELPPNIHYRLSTLFPYENSSPHCGKPRNHFTLDEALHHLTISLPIFQSNHQNESLASLSRSLDPDRIAEARVKGFFRTDAALAIFFISDEDDSSETRSGIAPQTILNKIKALQGNRPFFVGGMIYSDPDTIPRYREDEFGTSFLKLIHLSGGFAMDISLGNFSEGFRKFGAHIGRKTALQRAFPLKEKGIDPDSIQVFVDNNPAEFQYDEKSNTVHLLNFGANSGGTIDGNLKEGISEIKINYCLQAQSQTPPTVFLEKKKFSCSIRSNEAAVQCHSGEALVGGGCSRAMDGCYPSVGIAWAASGPQVGIGTAYGICCSEAGDIDLSSKVPLMQPGPGTSKLISCPEGFIALGAGAYLSGGWSFSAVDQGPSSVLFTAQAGPQNNFNPQVVCYKAPQDPEDILRVSGAGMATCPEDTQLLAGRWSGFSGAAGSAYPSGNSFYGPGVVTALCGKTEVTREVVVPAPDPTPVPVPVPVPQPSPIDTPYPLPTINPLPTITPIPYTTPSPTPSSTPSPVPTPSDPTDAIGV